MYIHTRLFRFLPFLGPAFRPAREAACRDSGGSSTASARASCRGRECTPCAGEDVVLSFFSPSLLVLGDDRVPDVGDCVAAIERPSGDPGLNIGDPS